jgi:Tol biopolymer transport system component/DNA-binding winged helix-turn-helix (wHTH) protein
MDSRGHPHRIIRFGTFRADLDSGELFKDGQKVRLTEQPFQFLATLLERPGEIVSRDELRRRLWPDDTHVDFDRSLNTAASTLRDALGDVANHSCYIETLPKKGYRFIAPLDGDVLANTGSSSGVEKPGPRHWISRSYLLWGVAAVAGLLALAFVYLRVHNSSRIPRVVRSYRITNDEFSKSTELATDGPRIYFSAWKGGRGVLAQVAARGGETRLMPTPSIGPETNACVRSISPDRQQLLIATGKQHASLAGYALWMINPLTLATRRVGEVVANDAAWSPDEQRIAYATNNQIWISNSDGTRMQKVTEQGDLTSFPRWSPDGRRIRFTSLAPKTYEETIWEVPAAGGTAHPLFPGWDAEQWGGEWTPDGKYFVFNSGSNLWAVREQRSLLGKASKPAQLTFGPLSFQAPLPSADGQRLYAVGEIKRGELLRYDANRAEFLSAFAGLSADELNFSRDGKWMAYVTYPQNELWRSRVDGSERQQLTSAPMMVIVPSWSPDDREIAFEAKMPGQPWRVYLILAAGGTPKEIPGPDARPTWSPDGTQLIVRRIYHQQSRLVFQDLRTGKTSPVPGSDGLEGPIWSPNGRYLRACLKSLVSPRQCG